MNNLETKYKKILNVLKENVEKENFSLKKRKPMLTDLEIIALSLAAESSSLDSECQLFRELPHCLKGKIERSVYNRRRRSLFLVYEDIRKKLSSCLLKNSSRFVVDSMPLEVCKRSRASRSKICREQPDALPDMGFCASQQMYYYGYKLHAVCSTSGVFTSFDLTAASVHDVNYLKNIKYDYCDCTVIGDKGYISRDYQLDLFSSSNISLEVPYRKNQYGTSELNPIYRIKRKRIETLFSQLCDQFMIRRNYAKLFNGFKTRIISKILSLTCLQLINMNSGRNINNLKSCFQ